MTIDRMHRKLHFPNAAGLIDYPGRALKNPGKVRMADVLQVPFGPYPLNRKETPFQLGQRPL